MRYNKDFLPPPFITKMKDLVPANEFSAFLEIMTKKLRKSIRINTLKADKEDVIRSLTEKGYELEPMPWYKYGFFIKREGELKLGNTLEHFLGKIYVQEAASMLPVIALDVEEKETILDLAAAPGSKTTQISMHMNNTGVVVANEPQIQRIKALQDNLERSGSVNHVITRNDGRFFKKMPFSFDRVLVDAPCSVEGTFRKDLKARYLWHQGKVNTLTKLQYELLKSSIIAAREDAIIIYSTCTLSPEENEGVVNKLVEEGLVELEKINLKGLNSDHGITKFKNIEYDKSIKKTVRIWPHKTDMEGFYLAKMRKSTKN